MARPKSSFLSQPSQKQAIKGRKKILAKILANNFYRRKTIKTTHKAAAFSSPLKENWPAKPAPLLKASNSGANVWKNSGDQ